MSVRAAIKTKVISSFLGRRLSEKGIQSRRIKAEKKRSRSGKLHEVTYFHQVDDPYSYLAAKTLKPLVEQYDIDLIIRIVGTPKDAVAPELELLGTYSAVDAGRLAKKFEFEGPADFGILAEAEVEKATAMLVGAVEDGTILDIIEEVSTALWSGQDLPDIPLATGQEVEQHVLHSEESRRKKGHYLGAVFCYGGESYWGLDRLHYLEERLISLHACRGTNTSVIYPEPTAELSIKPRDNSGPIDFFVSLRSPYSAIAARRVFDLARKARVSVHVRYVLPMVMRGLPVPREKALYIVDDAAREAKRLNIPFGKICDPLGEPTERGLALMPLAEEKGVIEEYLISFLEGVWADGLNAGTDKGLRQIAERAGLNWSDVEHALKDTGWRKVAEENRKELTRLGLWGVPSFKYGDFAVWGQDRLWALEEAL